MQSRLKAVLQTKCGSCNFVVSEGLNPFDSDYHFKPNCSPPDFLLVPPLSGLPVDGTANSRLSGISGSFFLPSVLGAGAAKVALWDNDIFCPSMSIDKIFTAISSPALQTVLTRVTR